MKLGAVLSSTKSLFTTPLSGTIGGIRRLLAQEQEDEDQAEAISKAIVMLLGTVIWADGKLEEEEVQEFRRYLQVEYSEREIKRFVSELRKNEGGDPNESVQLLASLSEDEKCQILLVLLRAAYANNDYADNQRKIVTEVAQGLDISLETLGELEEQYLQIRDRRERILKSGAGILVAVIVIGIFVLTATLLKSVLFGLILAYFFLPLERWYEKHFFGSSLIKGIQRIGSVMSSPVTLLIRTVKEHFGGPVAPLSEEQVEAMDREAIVKKSSTATVVTVVLGALMAILVVVLLIVPYVATVSQTVKKWADANVREESQRSEPGSTETATPAEKTDRNFQLPLADGQKDRKAYLKTLFSASIRRVEALKPKVESLPGFAWAKSRISDYIHNEENQERLMAMVLSKTGGFFSFTAGFVGNLFAFLLDILLALFFFSFFLQKMAVFEPSEKTKNVSAGEYLVRGIFTSRWMPETSAETHAEAKDILDQICIKLQTWVRGYLSIIFIEIIIYVTMFAVLGVPYPLLMGGIAGCTVLLPFIGPLASASLTILVCFAAGDISMLTVVAVIILYIFMNGVIEQLFLYPSLVGEALGLNALETIIVVLLGGLFAGLTGMIFAVPTASVLKYLIPKIYRVWQRDEASGAVPST